MKHSSFSKFIYRISILVATISLMGAFQVASAQKLTPRSTQKGIDPSVRAAALVFAPTSTSASDFTGDQLSDIVFLNTSTSTWTIQNQNGPHSSVTMGLSNSQPAAADYDNDGIVDIASVSTQNGLMTWQILQSSNMVEVQINWGIEGDTVVKGDYDGDGNADTAVWRASDGFWYINGSSAGPLTIELGVTTDVAVPGDYDGDGSTDPAVFRSSDRNLYFFSSLDQVIKQQSWDGPLTHRAKTFVPADYDGDGITDFAIYNAGEGIWSILESSTATYRVEAFDVGPTWCFTGSPFPQPCDAGDFPFTADYDNDGMADPGVWNPVLANVRARGSSSGVMKISTETSTGMRPVSAYFMSN